MKKKYFRNTNKMYSVQRYEGETIETKCARIIENNEPISDGAPIIYTEKKDGVRPEYDIRTDRWEVAQEAMDKVNQAKIAKSKPKPAEPKQAEPTQAEPTQTE